MTATFLIPVKHDHNDRDTNLRLATSYLAKHFPDATVLVGEQGGNHYAHYPNYYAAPDLAFHRTKMLNDMARMATTPVVVNYDCDVLLPVPQLRAAIDLCDSGAADFAYPYAGDFKLVPRPMWVSQLLRTLDVTPLAGVHLTTRISSVGGCVVANRDSWFRFGGENERMISYAPEDVERWERWGRLGAKVVRIPGPLYHIQHRRGPDSWVKHPYYAGNQKELERERSMSVEELAAYVESWPWAKEVTI